MTRSPGGGIPRGGPPDTRLALETYRRVADGYDASCGRTERHRRKAIELLGLRPGEAVLDVACGTGKSLPLLATAVGPTGRAVGIDQSPEMIALARRRIAEHGLANAEAVESAMESCRPSGPFDAALFCYTHDVLRNPAALAHIFSSMRHGARVVALGVKLFPPWLAPLNGWVRRRAWGYLTTVEGLDRPWEPLRRYVPDIRVVARYFLGSGYIACGRHDAGLDR